MLRCTAWRPAVCLLQSTVQLFPQLTSFCLPGRRASTEKLSDWRGQSCHPPGQGRHKMFQDTTRLRLMSRPSLKDALQSFSTPAGSSKLGRIGVSQSFREKLTTPVRPRDPPPPPPPPMMQHQGDASGSPLNAIQKLPCGWVNAREDALVASFYAAEDPQLGREVCLPPLLQTNQE